MEVAVKKLQPPPSPTMIPCAMIKCQYWVQTEVIIRPVTTAPDPTKTRMRTLPRSKTGPHMSGEAQRKKEVIVPIQEIEDSVAPESASNVFL